MEGIASMLVITLMATTVLCIPDGRLKRSYDDGHGSHGSRGSYGNLDGPAGYGVDSDERDNASVDDRAPCGLLEDSGSPERGYDFQDRRGQESHRGFSVKAAAAASSSFS